MIAQRSAPLWGLARLTTADSREKSERREGESPTAAQLAGRGGEPPTEGAGATLAPPFVISNTELHFHSHVQPVLTFPARCSVGFGSGGGCRGLWGRSSGKPQP